MRPLQRNLPYSDSYIDVQGNEVAISDSSRETLERLLDIEHANTGRSPVHAFCESEIVRQIPLHYSDLEAGTRVQVSVEDEEGSRQSYSIELCLNEDRQIYLPFPGSAAIGYYTLQLPEISDDESLIIIYPVSCYRPNSRERYVGLSVQLYAILSDRSMGIGDFGDIYRLIDYCVENDLHVIGVNPVHALFPGNKDQISPYYPSHRAYLNWMYIAPDLLPDWKEEYRKICPEDRKPGERINYERLVKDRIRILEVLFASFLEKEKTGNTDIFKEFQSFVEREGSSLENLALFDVVYEKAMAANQNPDILLNDLADSDQKKEYIEEHCERIQFFQFLQWSARKQLDELTVYGREHRVSIYLDLAVGAAPCSAECFSNPEYYAKEARIGAPPDPFAPGGQNWGLIPFHPEAIRDHFYTPFIKLIRSSMTGGGIIRMDHIMGLYRLYWVTGPGDGGYVFYNMNELMGIVALESQRNECMVIGEDLGTVHPDVRSKMGELGILSWKVLYFEKDGIFFRDPAVYGDCSVATVNTHDLCTLRGFWEGVDLNLRKELGTLSEEKFNESQQERARDKESLVGILKWKGLIGEESSVSGMEINELIQAVHRMIAASSSRVVLFSLHDVLGDSRQPNVPGTVSEYPNWSITYPLSIEDFPSINY